MKTAATIVFFALIFLSWPLGSILFSAGAARWLVLSLWLAPLVTLAGGLVAMFWSDQLQAGGNGRWRVVKATAITAWKILDGVVAFVVVWSGYVMGFVIIGILVILWPILEPIVSPLFREMPWLGYVLVLATGVWLGKEIYGKPRVIRDEVKRVTTEEGKR